MKTQDIRPLSEHRAHLSEHLRHVQDTGRPLFVTHDGRIAGVVLSPAAYDALIERAELIENLAAIDQSLTDIKAGRVRDARQAMRQIADDHGITLE